MPHERANAFSFVRIRVSLAFYPADSWGHMGFKIPRLKCGGRPHSANLFECYDKSVFTVGGRPGGLGDRLNHVLSCRGLAAMAGSIPEWRLLRNQSPNLLEHGSEYRVGYPASRQEWRHTDHQWRLCIRLQHRSRKTALVHLPGSCIRQDPLAETDLGQGSQRRQKHPGLALGGDRWQARDRNLRDRRHCGVRL